MKLGNLLSTILLICSNQCFNGDDLLVINSVIDLFKRPITILDLTYNQRYAQQILQQQPKIDCCYVIFNGNQKVDIKDDRLVILKGYLNAKDAKELVKCEDFDLVIANGDSIDKSNSCAIAMLGLFSCFICSTDHQVHVINRYLHQKSLVRCLPIKSCLISCRSYKMLSKGWFLGHLKDYCVVNTLEEKFFYNKTRQRIEWQKGINLWTYLVFDGVFPGKKVIEHQMYKNFDWNHNDYFPWNMILQGVQLKPIDVHYSFGKKCVKLHFEYLRRTLYFIYHICRKRRHDRIDKPLPAINISLLLPIILI